MKTDDIITVENCKKIYDTYFRNWALKYCDSQFEHKIFTENNEDGIISKIFAEIGSKNKFFVEFGARDGFHQSNTAALREFEGWNGVLFDVEGEDKSLNLFPRFLTVESVLDVFSEFRVPTDFDFLSVDIDGNDYWITQKILSQYRPTVVVVETNQLFGPDETFSIEYNPDHVHVYDCRYFGASLAAFNELFKNNGYSLCYCIDQNGFFIRNDSLKNLSLMKNYVGEIENLFLPRIPRSYTALTDGNVVEMSKSRVERMAVLGEKPVNMTPNIDRSMRREDPKNRTWVNTTN